MNLDGGGTTHPMRHDT